MPRDSRLRFGLICFLDNPAQVRELGHQLPALLILPSLLCRLTSLKPQPPRDEVRWVSVDFFYATEPRI